MVTEAEIEEQTIQQEFVGFVRNKFTHSRDSRSTTEDIWLAAFKAYRGIHDGDTQQRIANAKEKNPAASSVFIKVTKTKVQAAYGQILEVLFAANKFPIGVEPTPIPDGVEEVVRVVDTTVEQMSGNPDVIGFEGDGQDIAPGATQASLLNGFADKLKGLLGNKSVEAGPALDPSHVQFNPADETAQQLEKVIHDQLTEDNAEFSLRKTAFELCLLGTGILKGPFNYNKTINRFTQSEANGPIKYTPENKLVPRFNFVSCWNFYPDPEATRLEDAEYVIERHLLTRSKVRDLINMPFFDKEAVATVLAQSPVHSKEHWESELQDAQVEPDTTRYEVLEYWGYLDKESAKALGLEFDEDEILDSVQINAWVCNDQVLRLVLNPFTPNRIPYYAAPYEEHPYQIWGVGIPENMRDTQALMNGHMRMAIDNLRFAGNMVFEVNENFLVPGQNMEIYPGKVFKMQGGAPGQSLHGITFPNTAGSHLQMFDKAMQLSDSQTLPSFSHGQTGVSGVGRTASGISMLMGAAALSIKTVIRNLDHYLLKPLGKSTFYWNMQFNSENISMRGDVDIVARGTSSLMQKDVRTQRLISLLQIAGGDPMVNRAYIYENIAEAADLDPEKIVNSVDQALLYSQLVQGQTNANNQQPQASATAGQQGVGGSGLASGGANPTDATGAGGGNIGTGSAPLPGEDSFAGNP